MRRNYAGRAQAVPANRASDPGTVLPEACATNSRSIKATNCLMATFRGDIPGFFVRDNALQK